MFVLIVTALTLVVAAFVVAWLLLPGFRIWIEAPKYRVLEQERRFESERERLDVRRHAAKVDQTRDK